MFITKKHLSRRTLLRGMGVSLSLPLLDAMVPAGVALAQTAAAPRPRLGFFYFPHGAVMEKWTPQGTGRDFQLNEITQGLKPFQDQLTVVSNLGNKPGESRAVHVRGDTRRRARQDDRRAAQTGRSDRSRLTAKATRARVVSVPSDRVGMPFMK